MMKFNLLNKLISPLPMISCIQILQELVFQRACTVFVLILVMALISTKSEAQDNVGIGSIRSIQFALGSRSRRGITNPVLTQ